MKKIKEEVRKEKEIDESRTLVNRLKRRNENNEE